MDEVVEIEQLKDSGAGPPLTAVAASDPLVRAMAERQRAARIAREWSVSVSAGDYTKGEVEDIASSIAYSIAEAIEDADWQ